MPGENPNSATLHGTNCYILGTTPHRLMIDAGDVPPINNNFIENLKKCMTDEKFQLTDIVISHSI